MKAAPADGHTLMCTISSTILGNRLLYKSLPYDPDKDFSFVSLHPSGQLPLIVHKDTGAKSIADFAAFATQTRTGTFGLASALLYPIPLLAFMALFARSTWRTSAARRSSCPSSVKTRRRC